MDPRTLQIADYTYELPDHRIAAEPLSTRDASKLLLYRPSGIEHTQFAQLPEVLSDEHLLVFNDSRVIRARMEFFKETGARIEVFCLEPAGAPIATAMQATQHSEWKCYLGNAKRWKQGALSLHIDVKGTATTLQVEKVQAHHDYYTVRFSWDSGLPFADVLEAAGNIPLPPYIERQATEADAQRYQTVYARDKGSVAAPTAGLHFNETVLDGLRSNGTQTAWVTLHVGAGTFKPVTASEMAGHEMHEEPFTVSKALIEQLASSQRSIVPVGTTSMHTLESLYWLGAKAAASNTLPDHLGQWEVYSMAEHDLPTRQAAFSALLETMEQHQLNAFTARTGILIAPGYQFRVCDGLITNFHQPGSTLLLLVAAFIGPNWRTVYDYALANKFRFLSYGDSSLLLP